MSFIADFLAYFKKPVPEADAPSSEETCAVCWGFQAFDKNVREMPKRKDVDVKNHKDKYMKLQRFMVEHIEGVKTRKSRARPFRGKKSP